MQNLTQEKFKITKKRTLVLFVLIITWLVLLSIPQLSLAADFYVSPNGDDDNTGTFSDPFFSLQRARDAARTAVKPVTIFLRGGTYYMDSALLLGPKDSGEKDAPVIYSAYKDEKPVLSGAVRLELRWTSYKGEIQQAKVPSLYTRYPQLFVNGRRQILARYPNFNRDIAIFNGYAEDAFRGLQANEEQHARPGAFLHAMMVTGWGSLHYAVGDVDRESGVYTIDGGYQVGLPQNLFKGTVPFVPDKEKRFIDNVFQELDAPGEWYLDSPNNVIYFYPTEDIEMPQTVVELVMLKQLVVIMGLETDPVRNIHFRGITFTHTSHVFLDEYEELLRSDWKINRSGAVFLQGAEDILIDRCHFDQVGGNAVFMSNYNRTNTISNCIINYAGESGICFVGDVKSVRSPSTWTNQQDILTDNVDKTPGPRSDNYPAGCKVHNNLMHDLGRIGKQTAGVYLHIAHNITVSHNTIYNVPRAAICIGTGHWGGHVIEFNDIFNTVQETGDHGPFNSWGRDRYWSLEFRGGEALPVQQYALLDLLDPNIIRNNRFHHEGRWGIDLDDGSTYYHIYNNLCLGMGVKLREGFYRTMRNNILINWSGDLQIWPDSCDDVVSNNIIVNAVPFRFSNADPADARLIDSNLFYNHGNAIKITGLPQDSISFEEWQSQGFDGNTFVTNPMFTDPANGNYSVQSASPALQVGFVNFPMDRFGVMGPDWEEGRIIIHKNTEYPGAGSPDPKHMLGAVITDITGSIRDYTGLADNSGVYLEHVPASSSANSAGFMTGDVILAFNGDPVEDVVTFLPMFVGRPWGDVPVIVLRDDNKVMITIATN
jgi:hypothetical protein